ncbi:uncharacterized protein LOC108741422 [Agrilus planipennis]|uniref:Uncharacterized protein LOC108741422 n=1 Tax=Agrilus planipennis TaxID=224129 RepID=A0A7F5R6V7_AGRPL|nr:uncharacterized protein LOC108741422 [Agrilus planipennis]
MKMSRMKERKLLVRGGEVRRISGQRQDWVKNIGKNGNAFYVSVSATCLALRSPATIVETFGGGNPKYLVSAGGGERKIIPRGPEVSENSMPTTSNELVAKEMGLCFKEFGYATASGVFIIPSVGREVWDEKYDFLPE